MADSDANHAYPLTWVTDHLAVGGAPMTYEQLDSLHAQGITAILNLCAEFCDLHDIEAAAGFEVHYLPIPDEKAPDLPALERALAWLDEAVYLGKKVLIHCRHGIGRTGTVLNAYLLRRGLGHKLAARVLSPLRSKPTSFDQWWTIRRYGKASGRLTIREPRLESNHLVNLAPFLADYTGLVATVRLATRGLPRCGRDHDRCCRRPLTLSLIEAVHVSHPHQRVPVERNPAGGHRGRGRGLPGDGTPGPASWRQPGILPVILGPVVPAVPGRGLPDLVASSPGLPVARPGRGRSRRVMGRETGTGPDHPCRARCFWPWPGASATGRCPGFPCRT